MPKYTIDGTGEVVLIDSSHFVAQGGEGQIFILGDWVYKICNPGMMIPSAKFAELALLDHPRIIRPQHIVLEKKKPVGFRMARVPQNPLPLAQILSKAYREREGISPQQMADLVMQKRETMAFTHSRHCLQVDSNELNSMVTETYSDLYEIDVNSYQTPHFPATAIMASVEDYQCNRHWSELSDWYSFCILSFYMFTGMHPYKGFHPCATNMKTAMVDCMRANKSVLDPLTEFRKGGIYYPFEDFIPGGQNGPFWQWYRAILLDGKRLPPPKDYQGVVAGAVLVTAFAGSDNFKMQLLYKFPAPIIGFYHQEGSEVVVTKDGIYLDRRKVYAKSKGVRVAFCPGQNYPVAVEIDNGYLKLTHLGDGQPIHSDFKADALMSYHGNVYFKYGDNIYELAFLANAPHMSSAISVASVQENGTQLFQGVAIQNLFNTYLVSVFPFSQHHRQIAIKELSGYKIIDAKFEGAYHPTKRTWIGGVLMIVGVRRDGQYDRFVIRFSEDWQSYDVRTVENINHAGLNFTVLPTGICLSITEEEKVEVFSVKSGAGKINEYDDSAIVGDMHLCHSAIALIAQGENLYSFTMKK